METPPFTKTQKVIQTNTSYKLAEIIRDTWPQLYYLKGAKHNERKAERINGWAAMIGVIAAMGSYATTGQIIPGLW